MHKLKYFVATVMIFFSHSVFADMFNVQLSNESGRFIYATELFGGQYGPVDLEMGLFFNQDDDKMLHLGMLVRNDTLDSPLVISVGTRLYYANVGNATTSSSDIAAIAIGGELLFIPQNFGGLGFGFHYFVAPSVVTFMDGENFNEYGFRLSYELTKQADVYLGYQKVKAKLTNGTELEVDSSAYFGIGMRF